MIKNRKIAGNDLYSFYIYAKYNRFKKFENKDKMIKKVLFSLVLVAMGLLSVLGQDPACLPDESYADSLAGVYPGPYHAELFPDGGIHDTACINHPFELTLTAVVSDSISYGELTLYLNYLEIEENGVLNLPEGLDYACNPPNCKFETNTMGCMVISGTPTEGNEIRNYDLQLKAEILVASFLTINDTLPAFLIPDSHYYLYLDGEDSEHCQELTVEEQFLADIDLKIQTNPVINSVPVEFRLLKKMDYRLELLDFQGRILSTLQAKGSGIICHNLTLNNGPGAINSVNGGYYLVRLITEQGIAAEKVLLLGR